MKTQSSRITEHRYEALITLECSLHQKDILFQSTTLIFHFIPLFFMLSLQAIQFNKIIQPSQYTYLSKTHQLFIGELSDQNLIYKTLILALFILSLILIALTAFTLSQCSRKSSFANSPYKKTQTNLKTFKILIYLLCMSEILMIPWISSAAYLLKTEEDFNKIPYFTCLLFNTFFYVFTTIVNRQRRILGLFSCLVFISILVFPNSIISSIQLILITKWEHYCLWGKTNTHDLRQKVFIKTASYGLFFMAIWNFIVKSPNTLQFSTPYQNANLSLTLFIIGIVFVFAISLVYQNRSANRTFQVTNLPKGSRIKSLYCHNRIYYFIKQIEKGRQPIDFNNNQIVQLQAIFMRTITDKRISLYERKKNFKYQFEEETEKMILYRKQKKLTKMLYDSKNIIPDCTPSQFFQMSINVIQSEMNDKKNTEAFVILMRLKCSSLFQQRNLFDILKQIEAYKHVHCDRLTLKQKLQLFISKMHCVNSFNCQPKNKSNNQLCLLVYQLEQITRQFRQSCLKVLKQTQTFFTNLKNRKYIDLILNQADTIFTFMQKNVLLYQKMLEINQSPQQTVIMMSLIKILNGFKDQIQMQLSSDTLQKGFRFGIKSSKINMKKSAMQEQIQYQMTYCILSQTGEVLQMSNLLKKQLQYSQISFQNDKICKLCPHLNFYEQIEVIQELQSFSQSKTTAFEQNKKKIMQKIITILDSKGRHILKRYNIIAIPNIITGKFNYFLSFIHPKQLCQTDNLFPYSIVYHGQENCILSFCQRFDRTYDLEISELIDNSRYAKPYIFDVVQFIRQKDAQNNTNNLALQTINQLEREQRTNILDTQTFHKNIQFESQLSQKERVNAFLNIPYTKSCTSPDFQDCRRYKIHCTILPLNHKWNIMVIYPGHMGVYPISSRNGFISQKSLNNIGSMQQLSSSNIPRQQGFFCKIQNAYKFKIAEKIMQISEHSCSSHNCAILFSIGLLIISLILFVGFNFYLLNQNIKYQVRNLEDTRLKNNFYYDFVLNYKDSLYLILNSQVKHQQFPFENNITSISILRMQEKLSKNLKKFLKINTNQEQHNISKINYTLIFKNFDVQTDTAQTTLIDYIVQMKIVLQSINSFENPYVNLSDFEVGKSVQFLLENYRNIMMFKQHYQQKTYNPQAILLPFYLGIGIFFLLIGISFLVILIFLHKKYRTILKINQIFNVISQKDYEQIIWRLQQIIQNIKNIDLIIDKKQNDFKNRKQLISSKQDAFTNQMKIVCQTDHIFIGNFQQQQKTKTQNNLDSTKTKTSLKTSRNHKQLNKEQLKYSIFSSFRNNILLIASISIIFVLLISIFIIKYYQNKSQIDSIFKYVEALYSFKTRQLQIITTLYFSTIFKASNHAKNYRKFINLTQYFQTIEKISLTNIKLYEFMNQKYKQSENQYLNSEFCKSLDHTLKKVQLNQLNKTLAVENQQKSSNSKNQVINFIKAISCQQVYYLQNIQIHRNFKVVLQEYESQISDLFYKDPIYLFSIQSHSIQLVIAPLVKLQFAYQAMNTINEELLQIFNQKSKQFMEQLLNSNQITFLIIFSSSLTMILLSSWMLYKISIRDSSVGNFIFNIIPRYVVYDIKVCKIIKDSNLLENLQNL